MYEFSYFCYKGSLWRAEIYDIMPVDFLEKGSCNMSLSYKKLWKQLIDRDMTRTELRQATGISPPLLSRGFPRVIMLPHLSSTGYVRNSGAMWAM